MVYKLKRVAVIGAGVSGLTAARHLQSEGLDVVVYERSSDVGGVWSYDERQPPDASFPSIRASVADFIPEEDDQTANTTTPCVSPDDLHEVEICHGPPGPAYDGLVNNVPLSLQELKGFPWPQAIGDFVNVRLIGAYLQSYAKYFGVHSLTKFNTRVEKLKKVGEKWELRSTTLIKSGRHRGTKRHETESFDAIVVASGHYHACRVPDIPGLAGWKAAFPDLVHHSKRYRKPDGFKDKNILLIGAGVSSTDIANETCHFARKIYQSSRGGLFDLPVAMLPAKTVRIAGIKSFSPPSAQSPHSISRPLGTVTLTDGTVLTDIDAVIVCTGYHMTYPFLMDLHRDPDPTSGSEHSSISASGSETSVNPLRSLTSHLFSGIPLQPSPGTPPPPHILVTNGTQTHNLHLDIFYIPDPTLAFIGVPFYGATFTLFEYQSIALSRVFSGRAWLPSHSDMIQQYEAKRLLKGSGRAFHSVLGDGEVAYVKALVDWVNEHGEATGGQIVEGHSDTWKAEKKMMIEKRKKMMEVKSEKWRELGGEREAEVQEIVNQDISALR